jgi:hypothetical protein
MTIKRVRRVAMLRRSFVLGRSETSDACHHSGFDQLDLVGPDDGGKNSVTTKEREV